MMIVVVNKVLKKVEYTISKIKVMKLFMKKKNEIELSKLNAHDLQRARLVNDNCK